jgi:hypothetical protein
MAGGMDEAVAKPDADAITDCFAHTAAHAKSFAVAGGFREFRAVTDRHAEVHSRADADSRPERETVRAGPLAHLISRSADTNSDSTEIADSWRR